jgi:hypothetical protein
MSLEVFNPNDFKGTDAQRINQALQAAAGTGGKVVVPRRNHSATGTTEIWLLDEAVVVPGETVLELNNCHLKLSDRCRDNIIRSANCGLGITEIRPLRGIYVYGVGEVLLEGADRPRATGDSAKTLGVHTFGTDAGVAGESQLGDWRNIGLLMAGVESFSLRDLRFKDTHCWAVSLENCAHGKIQQLDFASSGFKMIDGVKEKILNQDGLDLRSGCHDIIIENITGYSGDDLVALTSIPQPRRLSGQVGSTMVSADSLAGADGVGIARVMIRQVQGYCRGGHHIVMMLNTRGSRMHDIMVDGVMDTSPPEVTCKATVKIGEAHYGDGMAEMGDTSRIIVNNVISRSEHSILIGGPVCDAVFSNVISFGPSDEVVTSKAGPELLKRVTCSNLRVAGQP